MRFVTKESPMAMGVYLQNNRTLTGGWYSLQSCRSKKSNIFVDKENGSTFNRTNYKKLVKRLKPGDTLYIHSIYRLGRNYDEILEQWSVLTRIKKVYIVVLNMPILDTRLERDLMERFLCDVILHIQAFARKMIKIILRCHRQRGLRVPGKKV